ncbi:hypothetical protein EJ06DRAFT_526664 [Trichodelitschia bisporula]|uniref:Uncharacterized protein n=1 Tax=Trichodelitschia bisporula TaxID=703511 RepID=A0A6G1I962_9PEZI|nr:hypothetical protein EJ06DRAFT_526664 [Trichodelitschia bisporula]
MYHRHNANNQATQAPHSPPAMPIIPQAAVTPSQQVEQPKPVHPPSSIPTMASPVSATVATAPSTQWQPAPQNPAAQYQAQNLPVQYQPQAQFGQYQPPNPIVQFQPQPVGGPFQPQPINGSFQPQPITHSFQPQQPAGQYQAYHPMPRPNNLQWHTPSGPQPACYQPAPGPYQPAHGLYQPAPALYQTTPNHFGQAMQQLSLGPQQPVPQSFVNAPPAVLSPVNIEPTTDSLRDPRT